MKHPRCRASGFNLIEAAIVLGVVGLVIGGIWVAAAAVMESNRQSQTLKDILTITENLRRRFSSPVGFRCVTGTGTVSGYQFYDSNSCNFIRKNGWEGVVPAHMITSSVIPTNAWSDGLNISINDYTYGDGTISYQLYGLSKASCATFGPKIAAALSRATNLSVMDYGSPSGSQDISTPALAAANCNLGGYTAVTVTFNR